MKTNNEILEELKKKAPIDRGAWHQLLLYNEDVIEVLDFLDSIEGFCKADFPSRGDDSDRMANGEKSVVKPVYLYSYVYYNNDEYYLLGYDDHDKSFCLTAGKDFKSYPYVFAAIADEFGAWYKNERLICPKWLPSKKIRSKPELYANRIRLKDGEVIAGQYSDKRYFVRRFGREELYNADYRRICLYLSQPEQEKWIKNHRIINDSKTNEERIKELNG